MNEWKTTFDGKRPLTENELWQKTTFDGRQSLEETNRNKKTLFNNVNWYSDKVEGFSAETIPGSETTRANHY